VAWLGPQPDAVRDMGDKLRSKQLAEKAGVSIVPGYDGPMADVNQAIEVANDIGYPVLLKAASGGGGKGMRVCYTDQDMKDAFPLATNEATNFFKDPRLLVEKYIEKPHHIEFQVLSGPKQDGAEGELDILVCVERECSIQRRHQKILEESPSPLMTEEARLRMVNEVKALVNQVGYTSAGTVEFLVDEELNHYFLEMSKLLLLWISLSCRGLG
jgi:propionyl-CoA carboxylase alpha chain